jgi:hypothetical protein
MPSESLNLLKSLRTPATRSLYHVRWPEFSRVGIGRWLRLLTDRDADDHVRLAWADRSTFGPCRGQESRVHLTLVCGEGGQDFPLLTLRHLHVVERAPEFSRDFVELVR